MSAVMGTPAKEHTFIKLKTFPVVRQMGNATGQTHMTDKKPKVTAKKCVILTLHAERGNFKLPKGLIGVKTTAQVQMEGNCDSCIMDTGSQVTTVPKSYFDRADSEIVQPSLTEDCLGVDDTVIRENLFHDNPETTVE